MALAGAGIVATRALACGRPRTSGGRSGGDPSTPRPSQWRAEGRVNGAVRGDRRRPMAGIERVPESVLVLCNCSSRTHRSRALAQPAASHARCAALLRPRIASRILARALVPRHELRPVRAVGPCAVHVAWSGDQARRQRQCAVVDVGAPADGRRATSSSTRRAEASSFATSATRPRASPTSSTSRRRLSRVSRPRAPTAHPPT